MLTTKKLQQIEGQVAGGMATLRCPIGLTYHQIMLSGDSVIDVNEDIKEIRVVLNGKVMQTWKRDFLIAKRSFDKVVSSDGINEFQSQRGRNVLKLDFERMGLLTRLGRVQTAIGTGAPIDPQKNPFPVTTFVLEIDIVEELASVKATTHPAGTAFNMTAKAVQSAPSVTGVMKKIKNFGYDPQGSGEFEISDLPKGDLINRIFFIARPPNAAAGQRLDTTDKRGLIREVKIERDGYVVFERTQDENASIQEEGVRYPFLKPDPSANFDGVVLDPTKGHADVFVFDPTEQGYGDEGLATRNKQGIVQDLRFKLDMFDAAHVDVVVEYIGALGN